MTSLLGTCKESLSSQSLSAQVTVPFSCQVVARLTTVLVIMLPNELKASPSVGILTLVTKSWS